ncbi:hypothetical protein GCM10020331_063030 [Ectobacillus funiculus]
MLDQLKLVAPVRSKFMLQEMLEAGVDEIYVGVRHPLLQQLSFDNRFQTVAGYPAHFEKLGIASRSDGSCQEEKAFRLSLWRMHHIFHGNLSSYT